MHGLLKALGDRLEIASGETTVSGEAFGQDKHVTAALGDVVVVERQPSAYVAKGILLCAHGHAIGERGDLSHDVADLAFGLTLLALMDEPCVLGKPARIEEERHAVTVAELARGPDIGERDRLATTGVVRDSEKYHGHVCGRLCQ